VGVGQAGPRRLQPHPLWRARIDWTINRAIEVLRSLPELPLWLALSAAVPSTWGPVAVFFIISIILGILDWPGLARALSFLGLGLRAPAVSWGVMLNDAQNLASIEIYWWTAIPMLPIIVVVLAFNFLGDGLRASLDPYKS